MNTTQQPAPDYGEPWTYGEGAEEDEEGWWHRHAIIWNSYNHSIAKDRRLDDNQVDEWNRIVSCVNACAGMADPAKEIAALKQVGIANATMHLEAVDAAAEIAAMREAIREASQLLEAVDTGAQKDVNGVNWYDHRYITLAKLQPFIIP